MGKPEDTTQIHLYWRKLAEGKLPTLVLVLQCPRIEAKQYKTLLTAAKVADLGKQVEFILYSLTNHLPNGSYQNIFSLQNKYIVDTGAVEIQGVPMATMEKLHGCNKTHFHQWLLESKHVQSVKKLDLPEVQKWWILAHKDHITPVTKFLTTTVKEIMSKTLPEKQTNIS